MRAADDEWAGMEQAAPGAIVARVSLEDGVCDAVGAGCVVVFGAAGGDAADFTADCDGAAGCGGAHGGDEAAEAAGGRGAACERYRVVVLQRHSHRGGG